MLSVRFQRWLLALSAVLTAAVFAIDLTVQPASDIGALYLIPLLIASYVGSARIITLGAWLASMLVVLGALKTPVAELPARLLVDRTIDLGVIWTATSIVLRLRRTTGELESSGRHLADMRYTLDQSAIVAATNVQGAITYVNDKFCEISKYSRGELIGQDHRILNSGYHSKEFFRDLWHTIANGRIWRGEIRNRAKDGTLYWVDTTIVPFLDERAKPYQYMAIRYEITARKRSEEQLREQAALARLGEMAAVVAHEVKNPLAGIRGALQVIVSRMPADGRDRAIIGEILARLDALNGIVQDLLLYSRPREVKRQPVNLHELLDSTVGLLRRDPAMAALEVRVDGCPTAVTADPEQLRIVLQNVLVNAAQAMGGHGTIDVTATSDGERCRIAIRDRGPGMPDEVRRKAFDAFFTTKHRGTGLGLPIARRMIEAHGGTIAISPAEGGGTVVSVELPCAPQAA